MTHRFFVTGDRPSAGQARQIATVLRLRPGDVVTLVRDGEELDYRLDRVSPRTLAGTVLSRRPCTGEPAVPLTLAVPVLKGDRSEEVVEAVTQLGVARIVPFVSSRSVARALSEAKRRRWETIARESAETARRCRVPEITPLVEWTRLFDQLEPPVAVAWEGERERALAGMAVRSVVVGPEGGLAGDEIALARGRGALTVALGSRNLRSETAAIAAVSLILLGPVESCGR